MGSESGILRRQMVLSARRAPDGISIGGSAHELFEFRAAIVARVLEDRHAFKLAAGCFPAKMFLGCEV